MNKWALSSVNSFELFDKIYHTLSSDTIKELTNVSYTEDINNYDIEFYINHKLSNENILIVMTTI